MGGTARPVLLLLLPLLALLTLPYCSACRVNALSCPPYAPVVSEPLCRARFEGKAVPSSFGRRLDGRVSPCRLDSGELAVGSVGGVSGHRSGV